MKGLLEIYEKFSDGIVKTVGWTAIVLILMSLYQPLSFIPKFVLLFALTH